MVQKGENVNSQWLVKRRKSLQVRKVYHSTQAKRVDLTRTVGRDSRNSPSGCLACTAKGITHHLTVTSTPHPKSDHSARGCTGCASHARHRNTPLQNAKDVHDLSVRSGTTCRVVSIQSVKVQYADACKENSSQWTRLRRNEENFSPLRYRSRNFHRYSIGRRAASFNAKGAEDVEFIFEHKSKVNSGEIGSTVKPALVLIGCDQLWSLIRTDELHMQLPSELHLLATRLGHLVTGQVTYLPTRRLWRARQVRWLLDVERHDNTPPFL
ncbi:hypothetical protein COOONC_27588 [Cooperia oncophora]